MGPSLASDAPPRNGRNDVLTARGSATDAEVRSAGRGDLGEGDRLDQGLAWTTPEPGRERVHGVSQRVPLVGHDADQRFILCPESIPRREFTFRIRNLRSAYLNLHRAHRVDRRLTPDEQTCLGSTKQLVAGETDHVQTALDRGAYQRFSGQPLGQGGEP